MTIGPYYDAANELMKEIHAIQVKKQDLVQDIYYAVKSVQTSDSGLDEINIAFKNSKLLITLSNDLGDFSFTNTQLGEIERKLGAITIQCQIIPKGTSLVIEIPLSRPSKEQEEKHKEWDNFLQREYGCDSTLAHRRAVKGVM